MPLSIPRLAYMPLQKHNLRKCHSNFGIPPHMPFSTTKRIPVHKICVLQYLLSVALFRSFQHLENCKNLNCGKTLNFSEKSENFTENQAH
jgi:hypothetical protein